MRKLTRYLRKMSKVAPTNDLAAMIESSGLFDAKFYLFANPDVAIAGTDPLSHYLASGINEDRTPGPRFDATAYRKAHGHLIDETSNAMSHYLANMSNGAVASIPVFGAVGIDKSDRFDIGLALKQSNLFDPEWYKSNNLDLKHQDDLTAHFLAYGIKEGRDPGPGFLSRWYREEYSWKEDLAPFEHYLQIGRERGFLPQPKNFFEDWRRRYKTLDTEDVRLIQGRPEWAGGSRKPIVVCFDTCINTTSSKDVEYDTLILNIRQLSDEREFELINLELLDRTVIFADSSITLSDQSVGILQYYFDEKPAIAYCDFIIMNDSEDLEPYFMPSLSRQYLTTRPYLSRLFAVNCAGRIMNEILEASSVIDLFSKLLRKFHLPFRRVPHFLYTVSRANLISDVYPQICAGSQEISHRIPFFTIIIPTKNEWRLLKSCIDSVLNLTEYAGKYEILIVDNQTTEPDSLEYLHKVSSENVSVLVFPHEFNYSAINNFAAKKARGDALIFLNNDTIIINADWLNYLKRQILDESVGVVGAKLLYPDQTVQHGGVVVGILGVAAHSHAMLAANAEGFQGEAQLTREVLAVTAACMSIRKDVFFEVGGFDTDLKVAFNDIALCVDVARKGYTNVVLAESLALHLESKTRGYDVTAVKKAKFAYERNLFNKLYWSNSASDPFYNPNLSLQECYKLSDPPRALKPWRLFSCQQPRRRILMLSSTYAAGHGVAVVIYQQSLLLLRKGYELHLGGPVTERDMTISGAIRVDLKDEKSAAVYSQRNNIDIVLAHTPPFFSIVRFLAAYPVVILYDYGEPPPALFPDRVARQEINEEKQLAFAMADFKAAISAAVRDENDSIDEIIPLANSHLGRWTDNDALSRNQARKALGWEGRFIILSVCRFGVGERYYKGVDRYADISARVTMKYPHVIPVLVGKGNEDDVRAMEDRGLQVFANVSDEDLRRMYISADAFVSLSQWEGYNLPIAQALALGIPVVASKLPAHDAFGIDTFVNEKDIISALETLIREGPSERTTKIWEWDESLKAFEAFVEQSFECAKNLALTRLLANTINVQNL